MSPTYSQKAGRRWRYYLCLGAHRNGWASCPSKSISATEIEKFVVERIRGIGREPELVAATVEASRNAVTARRSELDAGVRDAQKALYAAHVAARAQIGAAGEGKSRRRGDDGTRADVPALEGRLGSSRPNSLPSRIFALTPPTSVPP